MHGLNGPAWIKLDPTKHPTPEALDALDSLVVVRTVPPAWIRAIGVLRTQGKAVALLLDDALLDPKAVAQQSWRYRLRLWRGITRHRGRLQHLFTELWVSTPALREQCRVQLGDASVEIKLLTLNPPLSVLSPQRIQRVAYLGTASHASEWKWLLPILENLQQRRTDCLLELIVPPRWRQRFRHLPRTRLLYPMDWESYLLDTGNREVEILLAPLLDNRFNQGRSPTKFFEAARLKAAGLFSARDPYAAFVEHGFDGLLLEDSPGQWLREIERLLDNPSERNQVAEQCRRKAESLCMQ